MILSMVCNPNLITSNWEFALIIADVAPLDIHSCFMFALIFGFSYKTLYSSLIKIYYVSTLYFVTNDSSHLFRIPCTFIFPLLLLFYHFFNTIF